MWYTIDGYSNYQINKEGVVRSKDRYAKGKNNSKRKIKSKVIAQSIDVNGYPLVMITNDKGIRKHQRLHRLMAKTFIPNPENKPFVNHIDSDRTNYQLENLEWCTHEENMAHCWKPTLDQIEQIKLLLDQGYTCEEIETML